MRRSGEWHILQLAHDPTNLVPDSVQVNANSTRLTWNQPQPGNDSGNEFHLTIWGDTGHQYPAEQNAEKNPHGFVAVDEFWRFFQRHVKAPAEYAPGDANEDGEFNSIDIILVLGAGKYETGEPASWAEGDWNGDGVFNSSDIIAALGSGHYEQGPYRAARPTGVGTTVARKHSVDEDAEPQDAALRSLDAVFNRIGRSTFE